MNEGFDISTEGTPDRRLRWLRGGAIIALGLLSLALYVLLFRPTTAEIAGVEAELERIHLQIKGTGYGYPDTPGAYREDASAKLERMRELVDDLSDWVAFNPELQEKLTSRFSVLEFEQRRFDIQQSLMQQAELRGASLPPDLFAGLPSYSTTTERSQLLWLHLEFFSHVLEALLANGGDLHVERIESLPLRTTAAEGSAKEVRLRLQLKAPISSLAAFLNGALPGDTNPGSMEKKAYSISRLDLQRAPDSNDGQVILSVVLTGFILNDFAL